MWGNTKLTADEMALMSLFESFTNVAAMDCIIDDDRILFIVEEKRFPLLLRKASGISKKKGKSMRSMDAMLSELSRVMKRRVEIVKFSQDVKDFIINFFSLSKNESVKLINRPDGSKYATIYVNPRRRGAVIGRRGYRAQQGRELAKKYFGLQTIFIR
jgi:N utilization substance protein A